METLGNDPQSQRRRLEIQDAIARDVARIERDPVIVETLEKISALREDVAKKVGLQHEMDTVRTLPQRIQDILKSRGYRSGKELYIQSLAQGLALFSMAFHGKTIIYRCIYLEDKRVPYRKT